MIQVCDVIMGSGKTSAAISYINEHPDMKFLFATPYLTEVERIKASCPDLRFEQPLQTMNSDFSKMKHTRQLLERGRNIATTHAGLSRFDCGMLDIVAQQGYTLVIDEAVNTFDEFKINPNDLDLFVKAGCARWRADGILEVGDEPYSGGRFGELWSILQCGDVTCMKNEKGAYKQSFYWSIPPRLFEAFNDVIILTYMFDGTEMCSMFKLNNMEYNYIGVKHDNSGYHFCPSEETTIPDFVYDLKNKIHIFDNEKLNAIGDSHFALSANWLKTHPEQRAKMKSHLRSFLRYRSEAHAESILWTTFKKYEKDIKGRGYAKSFIPLNIRATNDYGNRDILAYCANCFETPVKMRFFKDRGVELDEDKFALSTLIQWVWRSAIRNGEDITLYLPSRRMRELFVEWMESFVKP